MVKEILGRLSQSAIQPMHRCSDSRDLEIGD